MTRILIVEDDESIAQMTRLCLVKNNYACDIAYSGDEGARLVELNRYDLVLLDVMLPNISGAELIGYIKEFDIPVIFVTAKASVEDRVKGLRLGADDYIIKPFDLQELLARIEAVLRRYNKQERYIVIGDIKIDTMSRVVTLKGKDVTLSMKEYDLLLFLVRNKGIALYRERIYEYVWQEPYYAGTRTIDLHIQRLKKKLCLGEAIEAVYKIGYRFCPERLI
ncbi:MAG: response regulator transcription factor [Ruminococcaceae bacterium]|nr:response regulator transcription factor [Oscillospiraceae bacterium]